MIDGVGKVTPQSVSALRGDAVKKSAPVSGTPANDAEEANAAATPAADLAAQGAPVDTDKVARIKAAIADGSYKADPDAIAGKMIEQDLPQS